MVILSPNTITMVVLGFLFLIGCNKAPTDSLPQITLFEIDARLPVDTNGYYHLELCPPPAYWQTIHRISGHIYRDGEPAEFVKLYWTSSHYWVLGDSVGYIVDVWNCYGGDCEEPWEAPTYIGVDTVYVSYFSGMEVPTINPACYSNSQGEFNTVFAPVWNMRYDTVTVSVGYWDHFNDRESKVQSIEIVLY